MAIQILSNLNYPIGNIINQELQNTNSAEMAVAFLKYSGVKVIEKALNSFLKKMATLKLLRGLISKPLTLNQCIFYPIAKTGFRFEILLLRR